MVMSQAARIHVTFPVLNEEAMLERSIERTVAYCEQHKLKIDELCIADNGSTDRTAEVTDAGGAPPQRPLSPRRQAGLRPRLKAAWAKRGGFVGYMDIDRHRPSPSQGVCDRSRAARL
jgi:glycosyltransferase involved in cell wall biosynthesis